MLCESELFRDSSVVSLSQNDMYLHTALAELEDGFLLSECINFVDAASGSRWRHAKILPQQHHFLYLLEGAVNPSGGEFIEIDPA